MVVLSWIVSCTLMLVFVGIAGSNARLAFASLVLKKRSPSWIPIVGGVIGAIGVAVLPVENSWRFLWIPFLLDWGSLPGIVHAVVWILFFRSDDTDDSANSRKSRSTPVP